MHINRLLQRVIEGKIKGEMEVTGRRWRRCRKLLDDLNERRGYCHLKEEALDRTMWRAGFGRGFGPVVRQTAKWMNVGCPHAMRLHLVQMHYQMSWTWIHLLADSNNIKSMVYITTILHYKSCNSNWFEILRIFTSTVHLLMVLNTNTNTVQLLTTTTDDKNIISKAWTVLYCTKWPYAETTFQINL